MWIHLLSLELIDGAGGEPPVPPYVPPSYPGSGGGGGGKRELAALIDRAFLKKPKRQLPSVVREFLAAPTPSPEAVTRVLSALRTAPSISPDTALLSELREKLRVLRIELEDEEAAVVSLLLH